MWKDDGVETDTRNSKLPSPAGDEAGLKWYEKDESLPLTRRQFLREVQQCSRHIVTETQLQDRPQALNLWGGKVWGQSSHEGRDTTKSSNCRRSRTPRSWVVPSNADTPYLFKAKQKLSFLTSSCHWVSNIARHDKRNTNDCRRCSSVTILSARNSRWWRTSFSFCKSLRVMTLVMRMRAFELD